MKTSGFAVPITGVSRSAGPFAGRPLERRLLSLGLAVMLLLALAAGGWPAGSQAAPVLQADPPPLFERSLDRVPHLEGESGQAGGQEALTMPEFVPWSKLTFQSYRTNDWEIYRANGDGSDQVRLTNNTKSDLQPRFNRGATKIVFTSKRGGDYEIFSMNADGSGETQLTSNSYDDVKPAWSPDGSKIAYQVYRSNQPDIYVMDADGSNQTRLTTNDDYDGLPYWSPDGTMIAFSSRRSGQVRIWVMNADGSNQRQLSNQTLSENPAWSPDGSKIAYDADGNGDTWQEVWMMNADGSNQQRVYDPPESDTDAWVNSWSADSRYIAFSRISFVFSQGNWYWTEGYIDAVDSTNFANVPRISSNDRDWNPDWQTTDIAPPTAQMQALPAQSPAPFTVHWSGSDTGGSGLLNFDVQVKDGPGGAWSNWQTATSATSAAFAGIGGHTYYFRSRARDAAGNVSAWPANPQATTTVEALPPESGVLPLTLFSRRGVTVQWQGSDPGGSGIESFDVQYRQGNGSWVDWLVATTATSAPFNRPAGQEYGFRVRARDRAQNAEPWPPGDGDTSTTLYAWAIMGRAADNREAALPGVEVSTSPPAFAAQNSDANGGYAAYVASTAGTYSASWMKSGYGNLPSTTFDAAEDAMVDVAMPPADNAVLNWGFENAGLAPWQSGGDGQVSVTTAQRHSGQKAAWIQCPGQNGDTTLSQQIDVPSSMANPTLSFFYQAELPSPSNGDALQVAVDDGSTVTPVFTTGAGAADWTHHWADLAAWLGETVTLRFTVHQGNAPTCASAYLDEVTVGSSYPDLWVYASGGAALPGDTLTQRLSYGNLGGADAGNVQVTQVLPPDLTFISAEPAPATVSGNMLIWDAGDLAALGDPQQILVTLRMSAAATPLTYAVSAISIDSDSPELEQSNNAVEAGTFVGTLVYLPAVLKQ